MPDQPAPGPEGFKAWTYHQARERLWPAARFARWVPGAVLPEAARLPVDDEIAKLIDPPAANSPRLRHAADTTPLGNQTTGLFNDEDGQVLPFCPYREVRSHWIPFALIAARIEADWHQRRASFDGDIFGDFAAAKRALRHLVRHDMRALAREDKPILTGKVAPDDPMEQFRFALEEMHDKAFSDGKGLAQAALRGARDALAAIEELEKHVKKERRAFRVPRADQHAWSISFAGALGFAWQRLTGRAPSAAPSSPFEQFVAAAYASVSSAEPAHSWSHACRAAVGSYRNLFASVDRDPEMFVIASEVWALIPDQRDRPGFLRLSVIVDHLPPWHIRLTNDHEFMLKRLSYTIGEVVTATGIGRTSIFKDIKEGQLRAKKHGSRKTIILAEDVEAYLSGLRDAGGRTTPPKSLHDSGRRLTDFSVSVRERPPRAKVVAGVIAGDRKEIAD